MKPLRIARGTTKIATLYASRKADLELDPRSLILRISCDNRSLTKKRLHFVEVWNVEELFAFVKCIVCDEYLCLDFEV